MGPFSKDKRKGYNLLLLAELSHTFEIKKEEQYLLKTVPNFYIASLFW